ncbi:hypothetical protein AMS68_005957 [Peltaster fructicola]|uniref:Uncharacterized protein n=1 Tax=Peltaster fructicola TaxID=286661 RepID=A0A6H0Y1B1_9PEZI|nr:hypothetical protein AMS68_005957 [Peltaster fructicola]
MLAGRTRKGLKMKHEVSCAPKNGPRAKNTSATHVKPPVMAGQASRQQGNLYDAVAGRLTALGFLGPETAPTSKDTSNKTQTIVPPEEVLYRRKGAPTRYEEDDVYFQHRYLKADQKLPDSDLLKAIHAYAADFYARTTTDGGKSDEKTLDETALLAIGILLEELAVKGIGKTGGLALLEPQ